MFKAYFLKTNITLVEKLLMVFNSARFDDRFYEINRLGLNACKY